MAYNNKFYLGDYVRELEIMDLMDEKKIHDNRPWINSTNVAGETPVHIAARRRILDLFEFTLPYYNDIESCDDQGNTIIHRLIDNDVECDENLKQKRIDLLRIVLSKNADVNKRNKRGSTYVHLAATHCHLEMLSILDEYQADFSLQTNDQETALLLACKHMFKLHGSQEELDIIDFLTSRCDFNVDVMDCDGYTALHYAVERCSGNVVLELVKSGADVHCCTKERKFTPLHLAAKRRNTNKLDILVNAGANVNSEDIDKLTPLYFALLEGTKKIVDRLIEHSAVLNCTESILQFSPLNLVVYQQREDLFELLLNAGADVNYTSEEGLTPLHLSSLLGNLEFTRILIDRGADVNCRDANNSTSLQLAITKSYDIYEIARGKKKCLIVELLKNYEGFVRTNEDYENIVQLLIDNGADVNVVMDNGQNLIHMAIQNNNVNIVKILLDTGLDVNCKTMDFEFTPLHLAIHNNYEDVAELLIDFGADVNAVNLDGKSILHLSLESDCTEISKLLARRAAKLNCNGNRCLYTLLYLVSEDSSEIMNDYQNTSIVRFVDGLEDLEIKKSILCLCALVNSGNENDCMPVNRYLVNNLMFNLKCLTTIGFDTDDYEGFCKILFAYNTKNIDCCSKSCGLFELIADLRSQGDECSREIENLKEYLINDNVTLYELLHMKFKKRCLYADSLDICEIESKFPIYCDLILSRSREITVRKNLLEATRLALRELTKVELSIVCVDDIFSRLEIIDMIATIQAAELYVSD